MSSTNTTEVLALSLLPLAEVKGIQIGQYAFAGTTGVSASNRDLMCNVYHCLVVGTRLGPLDSCSVRFQTFDEE